MTPQQIEKLERGETVEMTGEECARFQLDTFNRVCQERDEARARVAELAAALEAIQGIGSKTAMISHEEGLTRAIKIATKALTR